MTNFTAIDFETANGDRNSICQVGLAVYKNGEIIHKIDQLVQPPGNYYWKRFTDIHGIDANRTKNSPTLDESWSKIEPYIKNQNVVAHNGLRFDFPVLKATLKYYKIKVPKYSPICTYQIYKKGLAKLCLEHIIALNHHDALSDAKACGELYLRYLNNKDFA
jgi:DNA polymerase-3 subunit epsilon